MAYDKQALIDQLSQLTIMELADLIDGLKETWGVEAVVAAGGAAGGAAAPAAEEKDEFDVVLVDAGSSKINVIKEIRAITGLGLKEAKDMAEKGGAVKEAASKDEANKIKEQLEAAGAKVELK
ncbi:50S ribosomal protein L7/L12 [Deinococcus sp. Marseille-Q6407]|uniref:50S ribosomal protein L7/L12 n=1 Tax=Deinococcus sp. Marseille-Q6407 TaxID=2969223 RepID=UPI0021BE2253|nr:50S ribosomal protein L7/L12 [Deinococcus sp. Marseille-Q6407]